MSSHYTSSSKKVAILYGDSPRTSRDSLASRSSSEYSSRSSSNMTASSTYGSNSYYSGNGYSRSSYGNGSSSSGSVVHRLVRDPHPTTGSAHGYYTTEREHSSGKKVTVHNHGKKSSRSDEPRSSYR